MSNGTIEARHVVVRPAGCSQSLAPHSWCVTKHGWRWQELRGNLLSMRISSFDGVMCGVRTVFDAGLRQVQYRDVFWVGKELDWRVESTRSQCFLTADDTLELLA